MKLLSLTVLLSLIFVTTQSQTNFKAHTLYSQKYFIPDEKIEHQNIIYGYDSVCKPLYEWTRIYKRVSWHCKIGKYSGFYWAWDGKQFNWIPKIEARKWWYFIWEEYTEEEYLDLFVAEK